MMKSKDIEAQTMEECKILYCTKGLPMTHTCMCWGWECSKGWHNALQSASCQLEMLNLMLYPLYKTRIQADQVKEKYGTLHFYWSVCCDNYSPVVGKLGLALGKLSDKMRNSIDYGFKTVVDVESHETDETEELTKEQYEQYKKWNCTGSVLRESVGKYFRDYKLWHPAKCHTEVTKHKLLHKLMATFSSVGYFLQYHWCRERTPEQNIAVEFMESMAAKIVKEAEDKCYETCEDCGCQIGHKWSPRCQTAGWVTYICDRCAEKLDRPYYKNSELWQGKTRLKTKEEVEADRKQREFDEDEE